MHICKSYCAFLVFLSGIAAGGLAVAIPPAQNPEPQQQAPSPLTEEQRRKFLEAIREQAVRAEEARKRGIQEQGTPAPAGQQPPVQAQEGAPQAAPTPLMQRPALSSDQIQLSYDNADLYDFVNQIADTLGITPIIIDPQVKGSVTIHSSAPMSREDVFPLFNLILKNNNAALVKQGKIYQIVPISDALKRGLDVIEHRPPDLPVKPSEPLPKEEPAEKPAVPKPEPSPPAGQARAGEPIPSLLPVPAAMARVEAPAPTMQASAPQAPPAPPQAAPQTNQTPQIPRLSTHVIRVEFVPVRDLIEPLKLFMTEGGVIMPYDRLNMLIITEYSDSVQKILEIIRLLDDAFVNPELVELIEIRYNASTDVVDDLRKILGSGAKDSPTGIYFISLDRLNAILVMANSKRAMAEVKKWIERLDATTGRSVQTFIYTVENSTASNIAMVLAALYGGDGGGTSTSRTGATATGVAPGASQGGGGGSFGSGPAAAGFGGGYGPQSAGFGGGSFGGQQSYGAFGGQGGFGGQTGGGFGGGFGGGYGGGVFGSGQQLGPRLNQGMGMSAQILRGGALTGLQENVRVVANDINNTLIIQASSADYAYLLEVIKKLDVLPRQVLIDARIFEVDLTDTFSFGIAANLQARSSGQQITTGSIAGANGALTAGTFAFVGDAREVLLALDALRQKTKVKVLEAPSVLALDGTVARIVVGGEVPYPAGSFFGGTGVSSTSVQYRDTGISLIVMPRISASGTVTLDIAQEVSTPGAPTPTGPTFNKTSVSTTLAVKDGETVAIAGLIRDSNNQSRGGVPFFSEIPLIGSLFGRTNRTANRTELLILISPHVIRTPERFSEMTQELRDSLRNVRKLVDEKEREHLDDMEDARRDRYRMEERRQKKATEEQQGKGQESMPARKPEN